MTRIFILDGHPGGETLSRALAQAYGQAAAQAGHEVRTTHLHALKFDPDFEFPAYRQHKPLEPCLESFLADVQWCEHLVVVTPMWWGGLPAKLKGLFDRALLPGRAFDPRKTVWGLPAPLFTDRTARVIITSDTPGFYQRLAYGNAIIRQLRGQILGFIGIKPSRFTHFAGATKAASSRVERWIAEAARLGARAQ